MSAREQILARIEEALRDVPQGEQPDDVVVPRAYARRESGDVVARFLERVSEYRADVQRVRSREVRSAVRERCRLREVSRLGIPSDLPEAWRPKGVELVVADTLDLHELDALDGALTGCALAIAETGTIVLDTGAGQGKRALTLVPDYHVCVVEESQVVGGVPEAMTLIAAGIRRLLRPVTFVSGPSATSDIELSRVEGVHGPRTLDVLLVATR